MKPELTTGLVSQLISDQFPQWANLPITSEVQGGWNNWTFRLGNAMNIRMPKAERYVAEVDKEQTWLPFLGSHLPLPIPRPLGRGAPGRGYPWPWSVYERLEGERAEAHRISDMRSFGQELGQFLDALQRCNTRNAPAAGVQNFHRGGNLQVYDRETHETLANLGTDIRDDHGRLQSSEDMRAVWVLALSSSWKREPVWIHGDMSEGNLLVKDGRLTAAIDFGNMAVGDPACDLVPAYTMLDEDGRKAFRAQQMHDAQTWQRARGWALWKALITIREDKESDRYLTSPRTVEVARRALRLILDDQQTQ